MAMSTKKVSGEDSVHYVPPRKKRKQGSGKMQPPLTPMIDVVFQLIIFFIVSVVAGFGLKGVFGIEV